MVAVVSGSGLGLFNSSLSVLGGNGASGSAPNGRSGERVFVNSATGNLVIQSQDETLAALGLDLGLLRTYNAQGKLDDDNADNWKIGLYRRVYALTGTVNTAGSTVTKVFGDGAEVVYTYDTVSGKYIGSDGNGAHDTLSWSTSTSQWTWTDGSTRVAETYDSAGKLLNAKDTDGNTLTYNYTGALLTSVVDASGQTTYLDYTGNLLQKIRVVYSGVTQTLTLYTYDASNRLATVTVDLSPADNVVSDNNKWVTTYTYDGTSARVASITQRYGTSANAMSSASFVYQLLNGAYRVTSFTDGEGKTTNIAYSGATVSGGQTLYLTTDVTDPLGLVTTYTKDTQGRLTSVLSPTVSGVRLEKRYAYDANGNVTSITEDPTGLNRVTTFQYDGSGNLLLTRDNAGNTITRTYSATNQLLTETNYLTPDPDGAGAGTASNPFTARYAYDAEEHLRFLISADGRVTEYRYNAAGQRVAMLKYIGTPYSVGGLSPTTTLSESQMTTWASTQTLTNLERADYAYDFRGNLSTTTAYLTTDSSGNGTVSTASVTRYVYDQRGNLLQRIDPRGELTSADTTDYITNFTYDGAGRLLATSQWISSTVNGGTTTVIRLKELVTYDDVNNKVVTTYGVTEVSTNGTPVADAGLRVATAAYNHIGALLTLANGTAASTTVYGTTTYLYDADNRLRVTTDPTGISQYAIYDEASRVVGTIDGDGTLIEAVFNKANQVVKTVRYADRVPAATIATLVSGGVPANVTLATIKAAIPGTVGRASDQFARTIYDAAGRMAYRLTQAQDQGGATTYAVTQYLYDGANRVTDVIQYKNVATVLATVDEVTAFIGPTADTSNDRRTRNFYDNDGHLAGTLDAMGYLTEYLYDSVGQLIQRNVYATLTSSSLWATGTLAQLKSGLNGDYVNAGTGLTELGANSYYYYDHLGRRIGELVSPGILTETVYNVAGLVDSVVRYNHVDTLGNPAGLTYDALFANVKSQVAVTDVRFSTINAYDGAGRLVQVTDRKGTASSFADIFTNFTYDALGNLTSSTYASGTSEARQLQKTYDGMGRILQELTAEGSAAIASGTAVATAWAQYAVTHTYDSAGRRIRTTGINDNQASGEPAPFTLYFYNADNHLQYTVNSKGEITENRFNALGQLTTSVTYSKRLSAAATGTLTGGTATSPLTSAMTTETIANAANDRVTSFVYTLAGLLKTTTTAEGAVVGDTYDVFGESTLHTTLQSTGVNTPLGRTYNQLGEVTDTQNDQGGINATLHYDYDAFGRVTRVTDQYGNASRNDYDRLGRTINTYSALNSRHTYAYDAFSRTLKVTNYAGGLTNDTTYVYADNSAIPSMTVTTPEGVAVTTTFNRFGQQLSVTVNGNPTNYSYDANGNLKTITDGVGTLESRTYDKAERLASTTDARGMVTTLVYDAAARVLTRTVDAGTGKLNLITSYTYDGQGRVSAVTEPNGRVTTTSYDRDGRVTLLAVSNGAKTEKTLYSYDKAGHAIQVDEENGAGTALRTTQYTYDHLGRRTDEYVLNADVGGTPTTLHTVYKYDQNGNVVRKIDPTGNSTWFVYDADNRQTYVIDALGGVTGTVYNVNNQVISTRRYLNSTGIPTVDRVTSFAAPTTTSSDRLEQDVYDKDGRLAYQVRNVAIGGVSKAIVTRTEYDGAGNVNRTTAYATAIASGTYTTFASVSVPGDAANDRVTRTVYDARNRVLAKVDAGGAVTRYAYDGNGNATSKTEFATLYSNNAATDAQLRTYVTGLSATSIDHLTSYWYDADNRVRYVLDAEGYLTQTTYNDSTRQQTSTVYNVKPTAIGNAITPPTVITNAADQPTTTTFDTMGRVVSVQDALGATESYAYDEVGNKISFTNKKGSIWLYTYDANHRLTIETAPSVTVYSITDGATLAAASSNSVAVQAVYKYDALGNVSDRIEAANVSSQSRTTHYDYDALGRQIKTTYPSVGYYNAAADSANNAGTAVTRAETSGALWSSVDYDTLGNAWRATDVAGNLSYKVYDKLGRVIQEIDALGYVTAHDYNAFGNETALTRYAGSTASAPTNGSTTITAPTVPAGQFDRTLTKTYDRRNEVLSVAQPTVSNYDTLLGAIGGGGTNYQAGPSTTYDYDAFGNAVRTRVAVSNAFTADTYTYFDHRNHKIVAIAINKVPGSSAIGYYTSYQYDQTGDLTQQNDYSTSMTAPPTTITAAPPAAPSGASDDRITTYLYDKLNRLSQKLLVNVEASAFSGSTFSPSTTVTDTTNFGYDALGNQTLVDANGVKTYSHFDVLGRTDWIAAAARDRGDGTLIIPITLMRRDAYGNIVEEAQLGGIGASSVTVSGNVATAYTLGTANPNSPDRLTQSVYDKFGRLIHNQDASGAQRFASYSKRGDLAKEWLPTVWADPNGNSLTETVVTYYGYDKLGRRTATVQPQSVGAATVMVRTMTKYDAFGEVTARGFGNTTTDYSLATQLSNADATTTWSELFEYDAAGRVWRSNQDDGVGKIYFYNVGGQTTAVVKSDNTQLIGSTSTVTYADVAGGLANVGSQQSTESVFDTQGHVVQQRDVRFTSTGVLDPIVGTFAAGTPSGGNLYLYWTNVPPAIYTRQFYYAPPGTPLTGSGWTSLPVTTITVGSTDYNAVIVGGLSGSFDFKVTYARAGVDTAYAIHSGNMSVTPGSTTYSLGITPRAAIDLSAPPSTFNHTQQLVQWAKAAGAVSATTEKYVNNAWQLVAATSNGTSWLGNVSYMNGGTVPFRMTEYDSSGFIIARRFTTLQDTGSSFSFSGVGMPGNITGFTDAGSGKLGWTTAAAASDTIVFRYRATSTSPWTTLPTMPWGTGLTATLAGINGSVQFEVDYTASGTNTPYVIGQGTTVITTTTTAAVASAPTDTTSLNLTSLITPMLNQTLDRWGQVTDHYDALNNHTHYRYNERGQVLDVVQANTTIVSTLNGTVNLSTGTPTSHNYYDINGLLIATVDPDQNRNRINYNAAGQITSEVTADATSATGTTSGTIQYVYNSFGEQVQVTDALGYRTRMGFDGAGRIVHTAHEMAKPVSGTLPNGSFGDTDPYNAGFATLATNVISQVFAYDQAGRRRTETNGEVTSDGASDETVKYWYDLLGHVIRRRDPLPTSTSTIQHDTVYTYDQYGLGKKTSETSALAANNTQSWQYDVYGRLSGHTDLGGDAFTYTYNNYTNLLDSQSSTFGQVIAYTYDKDRHVTQISETSTGHTGTNTGSSAIDKTLTAVKRVTSYSYDIAGRVVRERVTEDVGLTTQSVHQDTSTTYDELGRISELGDPRYSIAYSYDAAGNRTHIASHESNPTGADTVWDLWYTYDGTNRVLISQGASSGSTSGSTIGLQNNRGVQMTYNARGDRASSKSLMSGQTEVFNLQTSTWFSQWGDELKYYAYDAMGRMTGITQQTYQLPISQSTVSPYDVRTVESRTYDRVSRQTSQTTLNVEFQPNYLWGWSTRVTTNSYDDDGRLQTQTEVKNGLKEYSQLYGGVDATYSSGGTYHVTIQGETYDWTTPGGYGIGYDPAGNLRGYTLRVYDSGGVNVGYTSTYTITYRAGDQYEEIGTSVTSVAGTTSAPGSGTTTRTYNVDNELVEFDDSQGPYRNRYFANNDAGQAITTVQGQYDGASGRMTGAQALAGAVPMRNNNAIFQFVVQGQQVGLTGNFDVNYTPISRAYPGATAPSVVAQSEDTLRILAARIWGDGNLWYLIAQENGLNDPDAGLTAGTELKLPNSVVALNNNWTTFKPYDASKVIGDTTPTQPAPPLPKDNEGCGALGMILMIIVAIVVTVYTAGAAAGAISSTAGTVAGGSAATTLATGAAVLGGTATGISAGGMIAAAAIGGAVGSAASQLVGMATGNVDGFDWKGVALGAIGAGVGAGLGGSTSFAKILQKLPTDTLRTAAVGMTTSALTQGIAVATGLQSSFSWRDVAISAVAAPVAKKVGLEVGTAFGGDASSVGRFANQFSGAVAGSLVRGAFGGKVDITTVLADAFGNALGNSVVDGLGTPKVHGEGSGGQSNSVNGRNSSAAVSNATPSPVTKTAGALTVNPTDTILAGDSVSPDQQRQAELEEIVITGRRIYAGEDAGLDLFAALSMKRWQMNAAQRQALDQMGENAGANYISRQRYGRNSLWAASQVTDAFDQLTGLRAGTGRRLMTLGYNNGQIAGVGERIFGWGIGGVQGFMEGVGHATIGTATLGRDILGSVAYDVTSAYDLPGTQFFSTYDNNLGRTVAGGVSFFSDNPTGKIGQAFADYRSRVSLLSDVDPLASGVEATRPFGEILGPLAPEAALGVVRALSTMSRAFARVPDLLFGEGVGAAVSAGGIRTAEGLVYNGITGPGPLGIDVANTFRSGSYLETVTTEPTLLYRAYGGKAGPLSPYWSRTRPSGPLQVTIDSALLPEWGNAAESISTIRVPAGETIYEGAAAGQGGLVGGGSQVVIPKVNPKWVVPDK